MAPARQNAGGIGSGLTTEMAEELCSSCLARGEKRGKGFIKKKKVNEIITVCAMYDIQDRIKSVRLFGIMMEDINEGRLMPTNQTSGIRSWKLSNQGS